MVVESLCFAAIFPEIFVKDRLVKTIGPLGEKGEEQKKSKRNGGGEPLHSFFPHLFLLKI